MGHVLATDSEEWFEVVGIREVETEKAFRIVITGTEGVWFPKSQTTVKGTSPSSDPTKPHIKLEVKRWLIEEKGLLPFGETPKTPAPPAHVDPFPANARGDFPPVEQPAAAEPAPSVEISDEIPF